MWQLYKIYVINLWPALPKGLNTHLDLRVLAIMYRYETTTCLESREYGRRDPSRWPRGTLYPQKLALTSPTSGGRSVGIVHSWTQTTEFSLVFMKQQNLNSFSMSKCQRLNWRQSSLWTKTELRSPNPRSRHLNIDVSNQMHFYKSVRSEVL
jgi:hypothetical protein